MVTFARAGSSSRNRIRTGVAISSTELCAADIRLRGSADRAWRSTLDPLAADAGNWPSLAAAFADLARALGITEGILAISLLPPLAEVRRIELPPVSAEEVHGLLSRNASRYFANARGPQIIGALPPNRRVRGGPAPVIAAAASGRVITAIRHAALGSGWTVEVVAPAESAWAAAATTLWPALTRPSARVLIAHDDRTDLLHVENRSLLGVRRFRAGDADAAMIADTVGRSARIGIAGAPPARQSVTVALSALGLSVVPTSHDWAAIAEHPNLLAAHFAGSEVGPLLRTEDAVALDRTRLRKAAWMVAGAATALLVAASVIELWGLHRQLRLVQDERARLRPRIASTLTGRTSVDATYRHLAALAAIERASPHWSAVIAELSAAVPNDAYLIAIRARGDSIVVDGLAERAARVFDGLQRARGLVDVKAPAPVRRELQGDGSALDHFSIAARVAGITEPTSKASPRGVSRQRAGQ